MNCPKCGSTTLAPEKGALDIEIDRCPDCQGIWLDRGEIYAYSPEAPTPLTAMLPAASAWNPATPLPLPRCRALLTHPPTGPPRPSRWTRLGVNVE